MKTGIKKGTEGLLKVAIALCVLFSATHLIGFIYEHVPPYSAGQCLSTPNTFLTLKVKENVIMQGASIVEINMLGQKQEGPVAFTELRNPVIKPMECPNE